MEYRETINLRDGRECILRNGTASDGAADLELFIRTHSQTDYLTTYPDEVTYTAQEESDYLQKKTDSPDEIELLAEVEGRIVGAAGLNRIGKAEKTRHRVEFGISIDEGYWGLGIGKALTLACMECARKAGYSQMELDVVADNTAARKLYESVGFTEYGRNPRGFRSRVSGWQELIIMRLELDGPAGGKDE